MDRDTMLWLWLHYGVNNDHKLFTNLTERFGDIEELFESVTQKDSSNLKDVPPEIMARLTEAATKRFMDRYTSWLERNSIGVATLESPEYPSLLMQIYDPPALLFYKGRLEPDPKLPIAVIGSRRCSAYGTEVTGVLTRQLVEAGATIVTGLASGVDSIAAAAALDETSSAYPVIGVLGCGIDIVYPQGNENLYGRVAERGAIITEFLPKTPPLKQNFPQRNRIISGLSKGVLVVEAGERSGTSITTGFALEQGRDVYAVPGRINDPMSFGTNRAIKNGEAKPVFEVGDILNEYEGFSTDVGYGDNAREVPLSELSPLARELYMAIRMGEKTADELYDLVECTVSELNSVLTDLNLSGIIKQLPGKVFTLDTASCKVNLDK